MASTLASSVSWVAETASNIAANYAAATAILSTAAASQVIIAETTRLAAVANDDVVQAAATAYTTPVLGTYTALDACTAGLTVSSVSTYTPLEATKLAAKILATYLSSTAVTLAANKAS